MRKPIRHRTWEEVERFDECIMQQEKKVIRLVEKDMEKNEKCPYLKREENFFHYCSVGITEETEKIPRPDNPIYKNRVSTAELQLYCMDDFESCCFYSGKLKR